MDVSSKGRVVTFYSFKGGVGRTLALANVGWILASNGQRVLALDWDLEAPGLHRYFRPFLEDGDGASTPGLIELLEEFCIEAAADQTRGAASSFDTDVLQYVQPVKWDFPKPGFIDLLAAGRYDLSYPTRVNAFAWQTFYRELGGARFLDRLRDDLRAEYDYVLIDSRTGISDVNGVCTVQMPDMLIACFTMNPTSLTGCARVAESVMKERQDRPIEILPVPMRLEIAEKDLLERGLAEARHLFQPTMPRWPEEEQRRYWQEVAFFNNPYYSFNEVLSAFGDQHRDSGSLLASAERLTRYISGGQIASIPVISEDARRSVLARYGRPNSTST
jgi:MinD-like ATPase involved in chromosome partitioning or flagellar assembly